MPADWHYSKGGRSFGPVSGAELKGLAADGRLQPADLVWKEGMPEWRPAGEVRGLIPSAAASSPTATPTPGTPRRATRRPTNVWKIVVLVGAGSLFAAMFVPWWRISIISVKGRGIDLIAAGDDIGRGNLDRAKRAFRENLGWYSAAHLDVGELEERADFEGSATAWLWGWNTGLGIAGFVLSFIIIIAAVLPMCVPVTRLWGWIGMFVAAILGLVLFITSLVWIASAPGEDVSPYLSQGIVAGPYLVLVAALLVLPGAVVDGVGGLLAFIREMKARHVMASLEI